MRERGEVRGGGRKEGERTQIKVALCVGAYQALCTLARSCSLLY